MTSWNSNWTEIVTFSVGNLVEHRVARSAGQALEVGLEHAISATSASNHGRRRRRDDAARTVGAHGHCYGWQRLAYDGTAVEDKPAVSHLDGISREADRTLDEIGAFRRYPEDDDVAAVRQVGEQPASDRWKTKRKAVPREAIGPFCNDEIIADVERRQHRARWDIERLNDKAPERPGQNDKAHKEAREACRALRLVML